MDFMLYLFGRAARSDKMTPARGPRSGGWPSPGGDENHVEESTGGRG
jgi:hypothetical protein